MVKIISDSTCDLSQEVLERYDIDTVSYTHLHWFGMYLYVY